MAATTQEPYRYIKVHPISKETGINRDKIYNNFKGEYDSLEQADCKKIVDTIAPSVKDFFKFLGYEISIKRI